MADRKIELEVTKEAKALLADAGYDPHFGARPLKRAIQSLVQNPLATEMLAGKDQGRPEDQGRVAEEA